MTILYVTHDQEEALSMGTSVAVMDQGTILQMDSPERLYNRPQTLTIAKRIGNPPMNIIHQETYDLGIRPEHLLVGDSFPKTSFQATLERMEYIGEAKLAYISYKKQTLCARIPSEINLTIKSPITFCFDPKHCLLYNPKTKRLLTNQQSILEK